MSEPKLSELIRKGSWLEVPEGLYYGGVHLVYCPACECDFATHGDAIDHLQSEHDWPNAEIADWLVEQGL